MSDEVLQKQPRIKSLANSDAKATCVHKKWRRLCSVDNCKKQSQRKGFCARHLTENKNRQQLTTDVIVSHETLPCSTVEETGTIFNNPANLVALTKTHTEQNPFYGCEDILEATMQTLSTNQRGVLDSIPDHSVFCPNDITATNQPDTSKSHITIIASGTSTNAPDETRYNQNKVMNTNICEDMVLLADSKQSEKSTSHKCIRYSSSFYPNQRLQYQQELQDEVCLLLAEAQRKSKCRGDGHCELTTETRIQCKKCGLDERFRTGTHKEWIICEEEKSKKRRKIKENHGLKQSHEPNQQRLGHSQTSCIKDYSSSDDGSPPQITTDSFISPMTDVDWSKIHEIQTAYSEAMASNQVVGVPLYPATHHINSTIDLIQVPTYLSSMRLITYLKKTLEFNSFDLEDRVTVVKYNLLAGVFIHIVLAYDPLADTYHEHSTEDPLFQGKDWIKVLGEDFYHELTDTAKDLIHTLEYDRVVVKLLLIIILYTKGFCSYDIPHEPSLNNPSIVFDTQNFYVEILYKYCLHQYGFTRTTSLFTNLINRLFAIQRLAIHLKDLVHSFIDASQLSPLMQTVLLLSDSSSSS